MLAADHVVTREAALRDAIVGSGVPPERVTVLAADDQGAERLRAVCRDLLDRWQAPAIGVA